VQIQISARHGHVSQATQEKITEKVARLKKFYDRVTGSEVTVNLENREAIAVEVRVTAEHTDGFVATDSADELFAALDGSLHKIEQQLRKFKERVQTGHRQPGRKQVESPLPGETEEA